MYSKDTHDYMVVETTFFAGGEMADITDTFLTEIVANAVALRRSRDNQFMKYYVVGPDRSIPNCNVYSDGVRIQGDGNV